MRSHAPRVAGLLLTAAQGALLVQSLLAVPVALLVSRTRTVDPVTPMHARDAVLAFATTAVLTTLGSAMLLAVWKVWRTASRTWLVVAAALLAAQPLVWWYDAGLGGHFQWLRGAVVPAASLVLLLWPTPPGTADSPVPGPASRGRSSTPR